MNIIEKNKYIFKDEKMKLESLYLKDYERLYVSGIKELTYTPEKKIQVILGTNGSGKSSLLKEIIPNVDNLKDDYGEEGIKILKIQHRGNDYVIKYDKKSNKHSFIKNEEELNDAGQLKIQKALIDNEFKISKDRLMAFEFVIRAVDHLLQSRESNKVVVYREGTYRLMEIDEVVSYNYRIDPDLLSSLNLID
jgi:AAA15 family ATPase/GTPase